MADPNKTYFGSSSEIRRRMMMRKPSYGVDWYPIIQGELSTIENVVDEYGDVFATYDIAPKTYGSEESSSGGNLKAVVALERNKQSVTFGGNYNYTCIIYEEGFAPRKILNGSSKQTITLNSPNTYKHIAFYKNTLWGNNNAENVFRCFLASRYYNVGLSNTQSIKYIFIEKFYPVIPYYLKFHNNFGYNNGVLYIPDWYNLTMPSMRSARVSKLRLSKSCKIPSDDIYLFGTSATNISPNLTDIYVHWGLGEVKKQPFNRTNTAKWKLHIPNLGNEEDNAALIAEYRSQGWNYVSGGGIYNDVEETEPKEMIL